MGTGVFLFSMRTKSKNLCGYSTRNSIDRIHIKSFESPEFLNKMPELLYLNSGKLRLH